MSITIALITFQDNGVYHNPATINEDDLLINFLQSKGMQLKKEIWNDASVIWENYDLVIIKSPWDYFNLISEFYDWLNLLAEKKVKVLNPLSVIKWNADKHYLHDIAGAGLSVTPSVFAEKGAKINLSKYFTDFRTEKIIVKPVVSGGSKNTFKVTQANVEEVNSQLDILLQEEGFIIQPFLENIETDGEWSFIFFGGKISHSLLKKAKPGDFRVQSTFGGSVHPQKPSKELLAQVQAYVDQFAKDCLYSRVDGAIVNDQFILMELELIEPFLFLETSEKSLENYYKALAYYLN
jgi:glutathione synthase/RimK-type ligase-like ATP-grasp enzyme